MINQTEKPKALIMASVASMVDLFNRENINILLSMGYEVHVAANFKYGSITSQERVDAYKAELLNKGIVVYDLPIPRNIKSISKIMLSYLKIKQICGENQYKIVHCHSPVGGVIARLACRNLRKKIGTKIIYTAHGFHFFKMAPLKNWLMYYPIEKLCSFWTDVLITINIEDYTLAKNNMKAKKVEYVPGIGIDTHKFSTSRVEKAVMRENLGAKPETIILLSIGELSKRKNHAIIIKALAKIGNPFIQYYIVGIGRLKKELEQLAIRLEVISQVHFMGYRSDIPELLHAADIFCFPSLQEGLPVALMEAMAAGLPCIVSRVRGNTDLFQRQKIDLQCDPQNVIEFGNKINLLSQNAELRDEIGRHNKDIALQYDISKINDYMRRVYLNNSLTNSYDTIHSDAGIALAELLNSKHIIDGSNKGVIAKTKAFYTEVKDVH